MFKCFKSSYKGKPIMTTTDENIKLRQYRNHLVTGGTAVLAFGVWNAMRLILYALMSSNSEELFTSLRAEGISSVYIVFIIIIVLLVASSIDLIIRAYVGLSARAEGLEKRQGKVYPVFAVILVITNFLSMIYDIIHYWDVYENTLRLRGSVLLDVISLFASVQLVISIYQVRKITRSVAK